MKIGIDISQIAYENTGVSNFLQKLLIHMITTDSNNTYILFFSSLRQKIPLSFQEFLSEQDSKHVVIKKFPLPQSVLTFLWNRLHQFPIEIFVGNVDIFITSDWAEPPVLKAKKLTIVYDLTVYTYPKETDNGIIKTQKKKLQWVLKESQGVICISESTKKDVQKFLGIAEEKCYVVYPGL